MSAHTPGPWKLWNSGFTGEPFILYVGEVPPNSNGTCAPDSYLGELSGDRWRVCGDHLHIVDEAAANARLIAAAPDLLEALREFVGAVDAGTRFADISVVVTARTAIVKAMGGAE